jgi:transcriptional regulator with XRE-family HTH domain
VSGRVARRRGAAAVGTVRATAEPRPWHEEGRMAVLMREAIGGSLRRARTEGRRTLREVSRRARVSLGYLSEVERGRKEASSELLAAICEALEISLSDVLAEAAEVIARSLAADGAEVLMPARRPIGLRHMDLRLAGTEPIPAPLAPMPVRGVCAAA